MVQGYGLFSGSFLGWLAAPGQVPPPRDPFPEMATSIPGKFHGCILFAQQPPHGQTYFHKGEGSGVPWAPLGKLIQK